MAIVPYAVADVCLKIRVCLGDRSYSGQSNLQSRGNGGAGPSEMVLRGLSDGSERRLGSAALVFNAGITWESTEIHFQGAQDRS